MPYSAGTAWLQIIPSFLHIDQALERDVNRLARQIDRGLASSLPDAIHRGVADGTRNVDREGRRAGERFGGTFSDSFRRRVDRALRDLPPAEIGVARGAADQAMKDLRADLEQVRDQHIRLEIDDDAAIASIERIRQRMLDLEREAGDRATVVNLRAAGAELDAFHDMVRQARRSGREAGGNFGGAFGEETRRHFDTVLRDLPDIPLRPDLTIFDHAMRSVRRQLTELRDFRIGIDGDADEFFRRVRVVEARMEQLRRADVSIPVNFDLDRAMAGLRQFVTRAAPDLGRQGADRFGGVFADTVSQRIAGALRALPEVEIRADTSPALREIHRIRAELVSIRDLHIRGDLDATQVLARLTVLQARMAQISAQDVDIQVRADTAAATLQLAAIAALAGRLDNDVAQIGSAAGATLGRLGALIAAALSLGTVLVPAAAAAAFAVGAIGTAAAAAGAGLGVLILGLSGVVSGVSALHKFEQDANKAAKSLSASQASIASAIDGVASSERSLANTRENAARSAQQASRAVAEAQRRVTDAVKDARQAQLDLIEAVKEARRLDQDRALSLRDNALAQRQSNLDIADAKAELDKILSNPRATEAEREQARITYAERLLQMDRLKVESERLREAEAKSAKEGVAGNKQVVAAQERVADTAYAVKQAQQGVADAVRAQGEQARQSAFQIVQAQQAVVAAQRSAEQAYIAAGVAGGDALDNLNDAFRLLSPEAQRFTRYVYSLRDAALSLRGAAERGMLPGFQSALRELLPYLPDVERFIFKIGEGLGWIAKEAVRSLKNPVWQDFFSFIDDTAVPALQGMWRFSEAVSRGLASLIMALSAFNRPLGRGLIEYAEGFATWADNLQRSRGFSEFISYVRTEGPAVVDMLKDFATFAMRFVIAAAPIGSAVVGALEDLFSILNKIPLPILSAFVFIIGALSLALLINAAVMRSQAAVTALSTNTALLWGRVQTVLTAITARYTGAVVAASFSTGLFARALTGITVAATGAAAAMGRLSIASSTIGGVLAVVAIGLIYLWSKFKSYENDAKAAADGIGEMSREYQKAGIVTREFLNNLAATNPEARRQIANFEAMGVSAEALARAYQGSAEDLERVNLAIEKRIEGLKKENEEWGNFFNIFENQEREDEMERLWKLQEQLKKASEEQKKYNEANRAGVEDLKLLVANLDKVRDALNNTGATAKDYKAAIEAVAAISGDAAAKAGVLATMSGKVAESHLDGADKADLFDQILKNIGESIDAHGPTFDALAGVFTNIANSALSAADKADLLTQAMDQMYGAAISQYEADVQLVRSQHELTVQLGANSAGFDLNKAATGGNTEAILANINALQNALLAARDKYVQDVANGIAEGDARAAHEKTTKAILEGIPPTQRNSAAVQDLNNRYGAIPPVKKTDISTPGLDQAIIDLVTAHAIQVGLTMKPPWTRDQISSEVDYLMKTINGKAGSISMFKAEGGFLGPGKVPGFSPHRRADNIGPIYATAGEWMHPVDTVDYYGLDGMEAIQQRRVPRQVIRGYAQGGFIGQRTAVDTRKWPIDIPHNIAMAPTLDQWWKSYNAEVQAYYAAQQSGGGGDFGPGPGFPPWPASPMAQRGDSGVWRSIVALIRATGPLSGAFGNSYRPGDPLWHGCVPMDTRILTRRGWITRDEIVVGEDETIGYNPATGKNEWTLIVDVLDYDDVEVLRIGHSKWTADVTTNHRWWSDTLLPDVDKFTECPECGATSTKRGPFKSSRAVQVHRMKAHGIANPARPNGKSRGEFVETRDFKSTHRIRLSAHAMTDGIPSLSLEDVRVIAWLQGDGHVRKTKHGWSGRIYQSKPAMVVKLRSLLAPIEHTESSRERDGRQREHTFRLRDAYVTDLMKRSELVESGAEAFVTRLSPEQRAAWLDSMIDAEGHRSKPAVPAHRSRVTLTQVDGPIQDAIRLAIYLEGFRPTTCKVDRLGRRPSATLGMARPHTHPAGFQEPESRGRQRVFCPTTTLGTWTARQGEEIFLTGNSGRAVDWMGYNQDPLADFLAAQHPLELIHRTGRRDYAFTRGQNRGSFNNALMEAHRNHIHIAMDEGGWLQPGWNPPVYNGTGRAEPVLNPGQWQDIKQLVNQERAGPTTVYNYEFRDTTLTPDRLRAMQDADAVRARVGRSR